MTWSLASFNLPIFSPLEKILHGGLSDEHIAIQSHGVATNLIYYEGIMRLLQRTLRSFLSVAFTG